MSRNVFLAALAASTLFAGGYLLGHHNAPVKSVEKTVATKDTKATQATQATVHTDEQKKVASQESEQKQRHRTIVKHEVVHPDGTKEITTNLTDDTGSNQQVATQTATQTQTAAVTQTQQTVEQHTKTETTKIQEFYRPKYRVGVLLGASLPQVSFNGGLAPSLNGPLSWGIHAETRVLGPFWLGAMLLPPQKTGLLSLSVEF